MILSIDSIVHPRVMCITEQKSRSGGKYSFNHMGDDGDCKWLPDKLYSKKSMINLLIKHLQKRATTNNLYFYSITQASQHFSLVSSTLYSSLILK